MAQIDPIPDTTRFERIAEPHQSTTGADTSSSSGTLLTTTE